MATDAEMRKELFGVLMMTVDQYMRTTENFSEATLKRVITNRAAELRLSRDTKQVRRLLREVIVEVIERVNAVLSLGMEASDSQPMKRPKDMTREELMALPVLSVFEAGVVDGVEGDDIMGFRDDDGIYWSLDLGKDGWYRHSSPV
jgi:hypothetical protein